MAAVGPFTPGTPIRVRAEFTGRLAADQGDYRLYLMDDDLVPGPGPDIKVQEIGRHRASVSIGSRADLSETVTFQQPGYYRVMAVARSKPGPSEVRRIRDTVVLDHSEANLWILVDEKGGRLTEGYDHKAVESTLIPLFGSYGPFRPKRGPQGGNDIRRVRPGGPVQGPEPQASLIGGAYATGVLRYWDRDSATVFLRPVPGAEIEAMCWGKSEPWVLEYDLFYPVAAATSSVGGFTITCPDGYEYIEGNIFLRNGYVYAAGKFNQYAGAGFAGFSGANFELRVANDYAARVFLDLSTHIPRMWAKFGRSRSRIYAEAADVDESYGINYCPTTEFTGCQANDMIRTNRQRVFSTQAQDDGLFVSVHEYAHGYHWYAVEAWGLGSGCGESHDWTETTAHLCSFREGVADFLAMVTLGDVLGISPYGGDYGLENNTTGFPSGVATNPPPGGDGVRVESSLAAFLYDLVDGAGEPDSPTNTPGSEESHDGFSVPASWVLDVIQHCSLSSFPPSGSWPYSTQVVTGGDFLVYCLERSTSGFNVGSLYSSAWRSSYNTVSWDQPLPVYDPVAIRRLWLYNLYGAP